ncbi:MAG: PKD domain-containing protein [Bacteroidota bacterium]
MNKRLLTILSLLFLLFANAASASHIVGGEFTYKYLGDSAGFRRYEVSLSIYEDCYNGQPEAIFQDNPAYLALYLQNAAHTRINLDTNIQFTPPAISVPANFSNTCVTNVPTVCLLKKTFIKRYALPPSPVDYLVSYQRCCRNSSIMNIFSPGDNGSTYFCVIPGGAINSSAVFKNYPPQIICINNPLVYDNSATDADGDSLSYEFCGGLLGASDADIKPIPTPPPYDSVKYIPPFNAKSPITGFPPIQIDPVTGTISGTPNRLGRFLVTVCCTEWRGGVAINVSKREFQFVVTDCSKVVVADIPQLSDAPNTYIVNCQDYNVPFVNNSKGGFTYKWDFGVPESTTDTSTEFQPTFIYPDTGTFTVKLVVNPGSTCPDSITRLVKVYPKFNAAFADSGQQCPGLPIIFQDLSSATIKPITLWKWTFGDGDSSFEQNPVHTFRYGGTYNVMLVSQNIKACRDTAVQQVVIQNFKPTAGDDTIIVKGEHIRFDAQGGVLYQWSPSTNLDNPNVRDPLGYYPDTGSYTYNLFVKSAYGCEGFDTITVRVVGQAYFVLPNAFSPNGDGLNDVFRPRAVGYRDLKSFRVFNRWGEQVYYSETLEAGWNGNYKNVSAELGVYFWEIKYIDRFGGEGVMKGDVTLLR